MAQQQTDARHMGCYRLETENSTDWTTLTSGSFTDMLDDTDEVLGASRTLVYVTFVLASGASGNMAISLHDTATANDNDVTERPFIVPGGSLTLPCNGTQRADGTTVGYISFKKAAAGDSGFIIAGFN